MEVFLKWSTLTPFAQYLHHLDTGTSKSRTSCTYEAGSLIQKVQAHNAYRLKLSAPKKTSQREVLIWVFPKMEVPQNGWFIILKWMIWGYLYSWKHSYLGLSPFPGCKRGRLNPRLNPYPPLSAPWRMLKGWPPLLNGRSYPLGS